MDEQKEQLGKHESASVSDETIRLFLLGSLSEDERTKFDERLFVDDELEERVRLAECEIADDYAAERLSAQERELFNEKFMRTAERKQKLAVSQALRNYSSSHTAYKKNVAEIENTPSRRGKFLSLFGFNRPALAFAVSFGALVLLVGLVWLITRNSRDENESAIVRQETAPTPSPQISPQSATTPTPDPDSTTSPTPTPKATPSPVEPTQTPLIATAVLMPGALRDGGNMPRLTLPKGGRDIVRLQLTLESNEVGTYRAELLTAEGQPVSIAGKLKVSNTNEAAKVIFDVPARLLKVGDYQVKLSRRAASRAIEGVGLYYFRALQK